MIATRRPALRCIPRWIPVLAVVLPAGGCGDDNPADPGDGAPDGSELAGTWDVTRFEADGYDAIANGTVMSITFVVTGSSAPALRGATGTFSVQIENDTVGLCDGAASCTPAGAFEVHGAGLVFDPGTEAEVTWTFAVDGAALSMSGVIDGTALQVEAVRGTGARRPR